MAPRVITVFLLMSCIALAGDGLEGYDKLTVDAGFGRGPETAQARQFIMKHWTQRRRAYLCFRASSIEGEPSTMKLYIEPSPSGRWHIRSMLQNVNSARSLHPKDTPREETHEYEATDVQWRRDEFGHRYLVFLDSSDAVIDEW